jgi:hypothetical protein
MHYLNVTRSIARKNNGRRLVSIAAAIPILSFVVAAHAALLPPYFLDAVVALGSRQIAVLPSQSSRDEWVNEGTGFFYGYLVGDDPEPAKRKYEVYLVTARHVVQRHLATRVSELVVRVNASELSAVSWSWKIGQGAKVYSTG